MKILINGILGYMGREVEKLCLEGYKGAELALGVDPNADGSNPIVVSSFDKINDASGVDCIVDFSHHTATVGLLEFAVKNVIPCVVATTGHTEDELAEIHKAAKKIPVFYSRNMSIGINLLLSLVRKAAATLEGFDIEIIEKHHHNKLDAPSGTALMLAEAAADSVPYDAEFVYERQSVRRKRAPEEIGIHAVRGGSIVGEHDVIFAGTDEVITISHSAASREVFAQGALRAAIYMKGKGAGMYDMEKVIGG